ncbi:MAG: S8 family serine peptidase [Planctomycetota bacterium]|nr:S8 family serine peptidase [Planctomycetota bacterium]
MTTSTRVSHSRSDDCDCVAIGAATTVGLLQRLLTFKKQPARSPYKALRLEPLERRWLMSIDGFDALVSPDWFGSYLDSEAVSHVNSASLSIDGLDLSDDKESDDDIVSIDDAMADQFDWIVQFDTNFLDDSTPASETDVLLSGSAAQFEIVCGLGLTGQVLVRSSGSDFADVDTWLGNNEYVASYELDVLQEYQLASDDPNAWALWGMDNYGQTGGTPDADIDAHEAWDISTGSSDIVVGVIDTGVDFTHLDLAANIWTNPGEIAGNGVDDDGNGFIDDIHGYDFVNNDGNPMDDHGHGTHVSGTIAAAGNNGTGIVGVNWSSSIMGLKFLSASGSGYTSDAVRAVNYATMMRTMYDVNVRVTNNSWGGGGYSTALNNAIQASGDAGILFVAAAGNSGSNNDISPQYPANYNLSNVISVAATDDDDQLAYFSCYGATTVDLAAPGVSIYSTRAGGGYTTMSGTSMATPHVAGVAALAWSVDPDATVAEIRTAILQGTDSLDALTGKMVTGGRLNAFNTLQLLEPADTSIPTISSLTAAPGSVITTDGAIVTLTAHDVVDSDGSIAAVYFYEDTNADGQHDSGDQLIATVNSPATADVTATVDTTGLAAGHHRYFARAVDNDAKSTRTVSTTIQVVAPDDHGNDAAHATAVAMDSTTAGSLDFESDQDWFAFEAVAGVTYRFDVTLTGLEDSWITLYDQDGVTIIDYDDDGGEGWASSLTWTADQSGTYYITVEAYAYYQTGSYSLDVILEYSPPTFDPVADRTMSHNQDTLTLTLAANDLDGDSLSYTAEAFMIDPLAQLAYDLDQELDLHRSDGNYSTNYRGLGEKYIRSNNSVTHFILPNGELYRWGGSIADSALVATFDSTYHADPTLLHEAQAPLPALAGPGTVSLSGNMLTIDPADGFLGNIQIRVNVSDGVSTVTDTFNVTVANNTPTFDQIADRTMSHNQDTLTLTLAANDLDGDSLSYTAEAFMIDPLAQLAYDLDQELDLHRSDGNYSTNYRGLGEKYIRSNNSVTHFILPNGELYRWGGSIADSALVATFDSTYHADPTLLHEAQAPLPALAGPGTVSLSGNMLTIDPADGFLGNIQIRVNVSDGVSTVADTFNVSVTESVSQASIAVVSSESKSAKKRAAAIDAALSEPNLSKDVVELLAGVLGEGCHSSTIDKYFDSLDELLAQAAS